MKRFLLPTLAAAVIVGFYAACSDNQSVAPTTRAPGATPLLNVGTSSNGEGQCMFADAVDAGYKQNSLQCTANDVDIGEADVNHYCISNDGTPCNPTTALNPGDRISCIPGQHIFAQVNALIQNSAQERYDMGLWILDPGLSGNANTGTQCTQYNLIPGNNGAVNLDGDQCGDVNSTTSTITVPLDVLDLVCPGNGATTVSIQACAGWSNSTTGSNDIVCPIAGVTPTSEGFRLGTTPAEGSKCTCNALPLPIDVKGVLRIKKVTVPSGSGQSFGFTTTGTGYTTPFSLTDGQTNSSSPLSAGTYTAAEGVPSGWDLTGRTCVNTGDQSAHTFTQITNGVSVALAAGEDVTCTFTNTQRPHLTVNKICAPTTDGGHFNLQIDATTAGTGANAACGGTTGSVEETIGSHTVGETAGTGTSLSDYLTPVIGGDCAANGSITLAAGDNKVCTITNTRRPKLTVNKVCNPTTDGGHFNLQIDAATAGTGANAACGGTTGAQFETIGSHSVGETAGTGTSLTDYGTPVIGGDCAANGSVTLAAGDNKVCTITNTRKGTLTVNKVCVPTTDGGHFNLQIDAATAGTGANAACGGTTGAQVVSFGSHTVGETAGTGTSLTDYNTPVIGGDCAANGSVTVNAGDTKVCTITNTRKPHLTVNKVCNPTTDGGHFNLQIDAATAGTGANAACGGTTGAQLETIGSHTVGETAGTGSNLTDYTTVIGGDCAANGSVTLAAGDNKVCTITNTRRPKLTVNKVCNPTTDGGLFNLQIDGTTAGTGANAACGGTTGAQYETIGSHTAGETAGTGNNLANYSTVIGGDCAANGSVSLAAGDNKTCTITNRVKSTIIIEKEVVGGGTQSFTFTRTLQGGGADGGDNPAPTLQNGGSSSSGNKLLAGNYTVCETNLPAGWLDPTAAGFTFTGDGLGNFCTTFALGWGQTVTVHVVNTPPPGGGTRTIGYWKNWSSCATSGGNQYAKAIAAGHPEETLDGNLPSVFPIGLITTLTCTQAVNLLAKNAIDGSSRAGDPIYNMVAQLLGAKLNVAAGAGTCSALTTALGQAQTLLVAISFDGTGSYKNSLTSAQKALATSLNSTLTSYNEGTLGGGCPTHI